MTPIPTLFLLFDGMKQLRGWEERGQESEKYRVIFTLQLQGPFNGHLVMRKMKLCTRECCEIQWPSKFRHINSIQGPEPMTYWSWVMDEFGRTLHEHCNYSFRLYPTTVEVEKKALLDLIHFYYITIFAPL